MSAAPPHADVFQDLWDRLDTRLETYPAPLDQQVKALRRYIDAPAREYFSRPDAPPLLLLPIWLGSRLKPEVLRDLIEATALLYLFIRIQDDVLDEPETRGHTDWLLLGNALLWDALALLRTNVSNAEFWSASRNAWLVFNSATLAERVQLFSPAPPSYDDVLFEKHCRKVAMAELPLLFVLSLENRLHLSGHVTALISHLGVAYGLTNDVIGFRRDVAAGMRTHLIDRVRAQVPQDKWQDGDAMSRALLEGAHIESFLERARYAQRSAEPHAKKLGISEFRKFTQQRLARLDDIERQTLLTKLSVALAEEQHAESRDHQQITKKEDRPWP